MAAWTALLLAALSCAGPASRHGRPSSPEDRAVSPLAADPDLLIRLMRPRDTDARIATFLKDHYALLRRSAPKNRRLLVFLPGTAAQPRAYQLFMERAAARGYLVVGLEYPNATEDREQSSVASVCRGLGARCAGEVRRARLTGGRGVPAHESVVSRLERLLALLAERYPADGWGAFWDGRVAAWEKVVLAGHSQGAGQAAMLAGLQEVARVILLSGPAEETASWMRARGKTRPGRFRAVVHAREPGLARIRRNYEALGVRDETVLDGTGFGRAAHAGVAADGATPRTAAGRPAYGPARDDLLAY